MANTFLRIMDRLFLRRLFDLRADAQDPTTVVEEVDRNVVFRGTNLWVLIFAIVICSVGLNVNSTAVIIGAMLISPLMGPIIGVGVGIGIYDIPLVQKAARNLGVAVAISIASSAIYFLITPLSEAQSELLARTSPTLWDVLIALFGGLAGIVAATRKEKTNVIPGVAIATALMPPLCTAGYGLATAHPAYFFGALYLFFINAVFISVSAFVVVRLLRFPSATFVDEVRFRRVRMLVWTVVVVTILPSIYLAYTLVDRTLFERRARAFVNMECELDRTHVLESRIDARRGVRRIDVFLMGEPLSDDEISHIQERLKDHDLSDAHLVVHQGDRKEKGVDLMALRSDVLKDLYTAGQRTIHAKDSTIQALQLELERDQKRAVHVDELLPEIKALEPGLTHLTMNRNLLYAPGRDVPDTAIVAIIGFDRSPRRADLERLRHWLGERTRSDSVLLIVR
ncbi:MAG: DUF389 domain-containing protein [Flavobacteriales bacterium]|nr:DUF389 domain-containing protein [Flavobacteriales bacterium]